MGAMASAGSLNMDTTSTDSTDPSVGDQISSVIQGIGYAAPAIAAAVVNTNNGLNNPNTMINPNTGLAYNSAIYSGAGVGSNALGVSPFNSSAIWILLIAGLFLLMELK